MQASAGAFAYKTFIFADLITKKKKALIFSAFVELFWCIRGYFFSQLLICVFIISRRIGCASALG